MADELLCCGIDQFLDYYAPFIPSEDSVDSALANLKDVGLLQDGGWQDLHGKNIPSKTQDIETAVFNKLTPIIQKLRTQNSAGAVGGTQCTCNFNYTDCGDTQMAGEIAGSTFQIDAYFSPASSSPLSRNVLASQVAVAVEFKRKRKDVHDVNTRILNIDVF